MTIPPAPDPRPDLIREWERAHELASRAYLRGGTAAGDELVRGADRLAAAHDEITRARRETGHAMGL